MNNLNKRTTFIGLATLLAGLAGTLPLSAQGEGGMSTTATLHHAQIGTLVAVGYDQEHVTVKLPDNQNRPAYVSYATDPSTVVQGLGDIMELKDVTPQALDRIVMVTYDQNGESLQASTLTFPVATRIRVSYGTIENIDRKEKILSLKDASGQEHRFNFDIGYGVKVDSGQGLLDTSDLHAGQEIRVFYARSHPLPADKKMPDDAYLIFVRS